MGRENFELQRTDSVCPPPEVRILKYVQHNLISNIENLVKEYPLVLEAILSHPYNKPILQAACFELAHKVQPETVAALIDLGADLYYCDDTQANKEAIHFAICGGNPAILKIIIDKLKAGEIDSQCDGGNTPLNLLIKEGNLETDNFMECLEILLEANADVNKADGKNLTPIFWAAKKNYRDVVALILQKAKTQVDINSHQLRGKSAKDFMVENNMTDLIDRTNNNAIDSTPIDILFKCIKENEKDFINSEYLTNSIVDQDDGLTTLLQFATKNGCKEAVRTLLNKGADPNKTTPKNRSPPIELAAIEGYYDIFEILINHEDTILPPQILIQLLKYTDSEIITDHINHNLCYVILLKHKNKIPNVNITDAHRRTALHFAARYGGSEKVLDLLRLGTSMACKDKYGVLPVEDIDANTLEKHLDECLETNLECNVDKENATATYNYETLMPPARFRSDNLFGKCYDLETTSKFLPNEIQRIASETEVISYMSRSLELKHLLKHPVVTSFLYIKWHRIRWFFYTNLVFYITFFLSLILYILLIYNNSTNKEKDFVAYILSIMLSITFVLLVFREIFQIAVSPKTYFVNLENWLELLLITLTAAALFQKSPDEDLKKQVSAITILLAAFEMVLLIGQHPKMSINIVMLRTVSVNFFKFLLWYSILILAFSLSFYTLFKDYEDKSNIVNKTTTESSESSQDFFINPGIALFKTIVMLTGEFDASDIKFEVYPITSHIIFMLFVFMIAIILFNLLNGLAVSDTQLIKNNAELVGYIARIEHIAYIESMFLGSIFPSTFSRFLEKYCRCFSFNFERLILPGILAKRVCLFPNFLKDYKMMIYPNKHAKVASNSYYTDNDDSETCIGNCRNIYLDKQSCKRTKRLIKAKKEASDKEQNEQNILGQQKEIIERQQKCIDELKSQQIVILNKLDYIITNISIRS